MQTMFSFSIYNFFKYIVLFDNVTILKYIFRIEKKSMCFNVYICSPDIVLDRHFFVSNIEYKQKKKIKFTKPTLMFMLFTASQANQIMQMYQTQT